MKLVAAPELAVLFSRAEVAELLQFERAAVVLQMRNHEQEQEAAAEEDEAAGREPEEEGEEQQLQGMDEEQAACEGDAE